MENLEQPKLLFWPPKRILKTLIYQEHASTLGAHRGVFPTKFRLKCKFSWPGMDEQIATFIRCCDVCQRIRAPPHLKKPFLKPYKPVTAPNERIFIDLFTNIPSEGGKKKHCLVMIDGFSKYCEVAIIDDKRAETVARALFDKWICNHSIPREIVHDNGTEFSNRMMSALQKRLGIQDVPITPLSPSSNGQIEQLNRLVIKYLQQLMNFEPENWESYIPAFQISYNCTAHRAHLMTPFYVMKGVNPKMAGFNGDLEEENEDESMEESMVKRVSIVGKMHDDVFEKLKKTAAEMKKKFDAKAGERTFKENDLVLVFYPKVNAKCKFVKAACEWVGPFRVTKVLGDLTYEVSRTGKKPMRIHAQRLKLYHHGIDEWNQKVLAPGEIYDDIFNKIIESEFTLPEKKKKSRAGPPKSTGARNEGPRATGGAAVSSRPVGQRPAAPEADENRVVTQSQQSPRRLRRPEADELSESSCDDEDDEEWNPGRTVHMESMLSPPRTRRTGPVNEYPLPPMALEYRKKCRRTATNTPRQQRRTREEAELDDELEEEDDTTSLPASKEFRPSESFFREDSLNDTQD